MSEWQGHLLSCSGQLKRQQKSWDVKPPKIYSEQQFYSFCTKETICWQRWGERGMMLECMSSCHVQSNPQIILRYLFSWDEHYLLRHLSPKFGPTWRPECRWLGHRARIAAESSKTYINFAILSWWSYIEGGCLLSLFVLQMCFPCLQSVQLL